MSVFLRAVSVVAFFCVFAGGRLATAVEPTLISSDWAATNETPAATVSATIDSATIVDQAPGELISDSQLYESDLNGNGCGDCCCFGYCPTWDVIIGALYLHRSRPDPTAIMTPPTGTPGKLISGSDFRFGWNAGPDIIVRRRMASGIMWEGRYFSDHGADAFYNIPSVTTFRVAGIGVTILGGGSINSHYNTTLDSTELNAHAPITGRCTVLAGFRAVEVRDTLRSNIATPNTFVKWDDDNHLYGGQLGLNMNFNPGDRLQYYGWLKAGVYGNSADNVFTSNIVSRARSSADQVAFVGDANVAAAYWLTQRIALRTGYQILWLDRLALANQSAATTRQIAGGTTSPTNTSGQLLYHGLTASIEVAW